MKLDSICEILNQNGYFMKKFTKFISKGINSKIFLTDYKTLDFDNVLSNENDTELYIIEEKANDAFSFEDIYAMEKRISSFIFTRPNKDSLKYNINLILICPIKEMDRKLVITLERNKYYCRKIFINSLLEGQDFENELNVLPFLPISHSVPFYELSSIPNVLEEVKSKINDNKIFELLSSEEEINLNELNEAILSSGKGD